MPRIRTIKPEFPQSETIGKLSRDARLLFIQLWTVVDDDGRCRAASRMLASLLYPYDDDAPTLIDQWLDELERNGCARRYIVDGSTYLEISNWLKHQKIDHPTKSRLPSFRESLANARETSLILAPDLNPGPSNKDLGPSTLTPEKSVSVVQGVKSTKPPRHGAVSADKRFVYFRKGTVEFDAYAQDYRDAKGDDPQATADGRWFKWSGEMDFLKKQRTV